MIKIKENFYLDIKLHSNNKYIIKFKKSFLENLKIFILVYTFKSSKTFL